MILGLNKVFTLKALNQWRRLILCVSMVKGRIHDPRSDQRKRESIFQIVIKKSKWIIETGLNYVR